jgi:hypothetical protein
MITEIEATTLDEAPTKQSAPLMKREEYAMTGPGDLLRLAVSQGANMEQLERLMAMQVAWEKREAEKVYNVAFAAFKAEAVRIIKNRTVTVGPLNGKKYAELFAIVNAVTPALSQHGLSASWKITIDQPDWIEVTCCLKHVGGHQDTVSMGGPPDAGGAKNPIQMRASTVSYLERYTLKAICGVSEQADDDDGNGNKGMIPSKLLDAGEDAAADGWKAFKDWGTGLTQLEREQMDPHFEQLKGKAKEVDRLKASKATKAEAKGAAQ